MALAFLASAYAFAAPAPPQIGAQSAVLMDAVSGTVLYEKRCHQHRPPASTTKIMTAMLAIEAHSNLDEVIVSASKKASNTRYASMHLKPGETLTLRNLLYGLLLRSGNDAAICVAENVAGSESEFVEMMNARAKELGAKDTHFCNPHGLHNAKHYTTAYDLALIARAAVLYPDFNDIVRTKSTTIERSLNSKDTYLRNTARFLWRFDGADGIKTGYTREAGHCFVGSATRGGWRLIAVVLNAPKAGEDTAALLDYGFKFFKQVEYTQVGQAVVSVPVARGVVDKVSLMPERSLALVIRKSEPADKAFDISVPDVTAPISKGDKLGVMRCRLNGKPVGTVNLLAGRSVDVSLGAAAWMWVCRLAALALLVLVGIVAYGTAVAEAARRRRRRLASRS